MQKLWWCLVSTLTISWQLRNILYEYFPNKLKLAVQLILDINKYRAVLPLGGKSWELIKFDIEVSSREPQYNSLQM